MNPTSFGSRSKPLFFNYIKSYRVPFQDTQKILRENLKFIRNSESKREFSQNILKLILFYWGLFWPWSFKFKITNHVSIDLWKDWLRGTVKIKLESFFLLRYSFKLFFFPFLPLIFSLFSLCLYMFV